MTTEKTKRSRLVLDLAEEDREWIRAQSEATGWSSEALVVRMLIRDARKRGVSFAVVAQQSGTRGSGDEAVERMRQLSTTSNRPPGWAQPSDVDSDAPPPVAPDVVENMLADRLDELGESTAPFTAGNAQGNVLPMIGPLADGAAVSLRPAPKRPALAYR